MDRAAIGPLRGHPRLDVHGERMAPAALGLRQAVVGDSEAATMVEAVAPYRMGVAEPAHREDRSRRDQPQAASAAEVRVKQREATRAAGQNDGKNAGKTN